MLFLICHSAPELSVAIWVCSLIKAAAIPASLALFMLMLVPPGFTLFCGDFVGLRVVDSSSNRLRPIFFVCNKTPIWEVPFFPIKGLQF